MRCIYFFVVLAAACAFCAAATDGSAWVWGLCFPLPALGLLYAVTSGPMALMDLVMQSPVHQGVGAMGAFCALGAVVAMRLLRALPAMSTISDRNR
jgi:hypothetical protein